MEEIKKELKIERLWKFFKKKVMRGKYYVGFLDFKESVIKPFLTGNRAWIAGAIVFVIRHKHYSISNFANIFQIISRISGCDINC